MEVLVDLVYGLSLYDTEDKLAAKVYSSILHATLGLNLNIAVRSV